MADLTMDRGEDRTVTFTFDGDSTFGASDVVWFTVKHRHTDADADAVVAKTSSNGGVTFTVGQNTATAEIPRAATVDLERTTRLVYDWQLYSGAEKVRTLDKGTITITPDVTRALAP